jgi:hypothetical protein
MITLAPPSHTVTLQLVCQASKPVSYLIWLRSTCKLLTGGIAPERPRAIQDHRRVELREGSGK